MAGYSAVTELSKLNYYLDDRVLIRRDYPVIITGRKQTSSLFVRNIPGNIKAAQE